MPEKKKINLSLKAWRREPSECCIIAVYKKDYPNDPFNEDLASYYSVTNFLQGKFKNDLAFANACEVSIKRIDGIWDETEEITDEDYVNMEEMAKGLGYSGINWKDKDLT